MQVNYLSVHHPVDIAIVDDLVEIGRFPEDERVRCSRQDTNHVPFLYHPACGPKESLTSPERLLETLRIEPTIMMEITGVQVAVFFARRLNRTCELCSQNWQILSESVPLLFLGNFLKVLLPSRPYIVVVELTVLIEC